MNPNEGAAMRRRGRHAPDRLEKEPPVERRLRRTLAAMAISALALGGIGTLAAAPALADDAQTVDAEASIAAAPDDATEGEAEGEAEADVAEAPAPAEASVAVPAPAAAEAPARADAPAPADPPGDTAPAPPEADEATPAAAAADAPVEASGPVVFLVPPGDEPVDKVEICHATSSYQNPYIINEPAADGDVSGHANHTGPIFYPEIPKHTEWGDIIPPFFYDDGDETPGFFPGLNWDAEGQAIYENDCVIPTPEPELVIFPEGCRFYGETGALEVEVGPVQENVDYVVTIWDFEGNEVLDWFITDETGTVSNFWILPPGDYTITLEQSIIEGEWDLLDEQAFSISACPVLAVTATVFECSTGGGATGTGSTLVLFTGLIVGEKYSFSLDGPGDFFVFGEFIADATSSELTADLPPGDFVASIEWIPGPGVELDPVVAMTTFTVVPCPPAPVVPDKPVTPAKVVPVKALPKTGASGVGEMLFGSMLLLGLGGATLVASRRRQSGDRHVS